MALTLPLGAGLQPAGTSPGGLGAPGSSGPATGPLRPEPVRAIDPSFGDYASDAADGVPFRALTATEQRALLALGTKPGTIAGDPGFGNPALLLKKDDGHLARTVNDGCRVALAALVQEGALRFDGATLRPSQGGSLLSFVASWTDLATGARHATEVR